MKFLISFFLIIFVTANSAQSISLPNIRNDIALINISLLENKYPDENEVIKVKNRISELSKLDISVDNYNIQKKFNEFESNYFNKLQIDSLKKLFMAFNNEFNKTFGKYFYENLFNSSREKIIIFSTSLSCECTLELCYKNESEIQKLYLENPNKINYAVIDCFAEYDLQNKFNIGFIPTVIVLDVNDNEIERFEREDDIYSKVKKYFKEE